MFNEFNEFDGFYDDDYGYDNGYNNSCGFSGVGAYKPMKATTRNVQEYIGCLLGVDSYTLDFVKVDETPNFNDWKHSCLRSGVVKMTVNQFMFEDGSNVVFATCPYCNKVHYYIDRALF